MTRFVKIGKAEWLARSLALLLAIGLPLVALLFRHAGFNPAVPRPLAVHARLPEAGGWSVPDIQAIAGSPIHLRLTSDDVLHGFAIGQSDQPAIDIKPGEWSEVTLSFDQPGKYTFYCTRWCGPNHWRMRGVIQVDASAGEGLPGEKASVSGQEGFESPLYIALGLDIDVPHPASAVPGRKPSASRGEQLAAALPQQDLPAAFRTSEYLRSHSPSQAWQEFQREPFSAGLDSNQVWDLVAYLWASSLEPEKLREGRQLYTENCAACHGESGAGDGVMAAALESQSTGDSPHGITSPADFSDASSLLGASSALLQGKILRGGMGTGMPYFGPLLTEQQTWALVDYLWTFQFEMEADLD